MFATMDAGQTWSERQTLTATDAAAGDWFGRAVALYNTTLVVGANQNYGSSRGIYCLLDMSML